MNEKELYRCPWSGNNELYIDYHDKEWGAPLHDDNKLFELLTLEGAQAGLSWLTVLKRRGGYRKAFNGFSPDKVARFSTVKIVELLNNPDIIRNRLKILSVIQNAKAVLNIQREFGSFNNYVWHFVDNKPKQHSYNSLSEIPSFDNLAIAISKDMQKQGFNFVGPTICYIFMQASGMVNDHLIKCFRYKQIAAK